MRRKKLAAMIPAVVAGRTKEGGPCVERVFVSYRVRLSPFPAALFVLAVALVAAPAMAQAPGPSGEVASVPATGQAPAVAEHPLMPALRMAFAAKTNIDQNIHDYTCTMIKRERVDGKLTDPNYMFCKVRQQPFSVYLYFLKPADAYGREVVYVAVQTMATCWPTKAKV